MLCFVIWASPLSAALPLSNFWFVNHGGVVEEFVGLTLREGGMVVVEWGRVAEGEKGVRKIQARVGRFRVGMDVKREEALGRLNKE
jgi:hypothetical protein